MTRQPTVHIVGAGMGGCLMSIYMAQKGLEVDLSERRPDVRRETLPGGRSINLTIAARAIAALEEVGLSDAFLDLTVPLKGRMVHRSNGTCEYQPYGNASQDKIYSIKRSLLNKALLDAIDRHSGIRLHFNQACIGLDKESRRLLLRDEVTQETFDTAPDIVVGADGVFSTVRTAMQRGEIANRSQEFVDWGYKELLIPPGPDGEHAFKNDVLHVWPRGESLLLGMPNPDGSFTGTLCLPFEGPTSFHSLSTTEDLLGFCHERFPDAVAVIPTLAEDLADTAASGFLTLSTDPWYWNDWVVLLGDACHTVLPFYGQGMNATFEDCSYLARHLLDDGDRERAFRRYQEERKRNTDALAMLSKKNFVELRDLVRSPLVRYRKKTDLFLNRCLPNTWIPLYTLISHSTVPYATAVEKAEKQRRILRWTGVDLLLRVGSALTSTVESARRRLRESTRSSGPKGEPSTRPSIPADEGDGTWATLFRFAKSLPRWMLILAGVAGLATGSVRAALLAVINSAMNQAVGQAGDYALPFLGLAGLLLGSQILSRLLMIRLAQDVMFDLRMKLCREILAAPLRKVEKTGTPRLLAALTGDVGAISGILLSLPNVAIHLSTIVVCLIYLGWLSPTAVSSLIVVMGFGAASYYILTTKGFDRLKIAREDLNRLFGHFRAVADGNKEFKLNAERRRSFIAEGLEAVADAYRTNNTVGRSIYALAESWGHLLFFGYIGLLIFWIAGMQSMDQEVLTGYTLVILYVVVPLEMLLMVIPQFVRAKIAVENIKQIGLSLRKTIVDEDTDDIRPLRTSWQRLELDEVSKSYSENGDGFRLGPISLTFRPGELVFLRGGNGSGKSTLAKLLTGLYVPDTGEIRLDGKVITSRDRGCFRQHFSAVFSDFFLLDNLYGLESRASPDAARDFLERFQLDGIVEINDGVFSTVDLSTGQRKRLALLTALLEDRPFYVFDEWAADQDPEFKEIFYAEILPEMRSRGKAVLVITHDDKYAYIADRLVTLDYGRVRAQVHRNGPQASMDGAQVSPRREGESSALINNATKAESNVE